MLPSRMWVSCVNIARLSPLPPCVTFSRLNRNVRNRRPWGGGWTCGGGGYRNAPPPPLTVALPEKNLKLFPQWYRPPDQNGISGKVLSTTNDVGIVPKGTWEGVWETAARQTSTSRPADEQSIALIFLGCVLWGLQCLHSLLTKVEGLPDNSPYFPQRGMGGGQSPHNRNAVCCNRFALGGPRSRLRAPRRPVPSPSADLRTISSPTSGTSRWSPSQSSWRCWSPCSA